MIISPRKSLVSLCEEFPECRAFSTDQRFDMGRLIPLEDPEFAIKFAFLEHLLRITTPEEEARRAVRGLSTELGEIMTALLDGKDSLFQEAFTILEQSISLEQLSEMSVPDVALHLLFAGEEKVKEREVYATGVNPLPYVYVGVLREACIVMYTTSMTFLDGFNSTTSQQVNPVISHDLLTSMSREMYWEDQGSGIPTQTGIQDSPIRSLPEESPSGVIIHLSKPHQPMQAVHKPRPMAKAIAVEWRSLDLKAKHQRRSREACEGFSCGIQ